jgi:YetA-like protein
MHTYDIDRHTWRYDIGGYAWDNSELSPDLYFWQASLRTSDPDLYRFAEALTRHTGDVDSYHLGDWKGLCTRHGVLHFADSAKQARIAQPQYRKYFYYLSGGDERVGEILEENLDADKTYGILDPLRKARTDGWTLKPGQPISISLGTDWAALAAGWLIEWERRGPRWEKARDKLTATASGIANLTNGFVTGSGLYDMDTGTLLPPPADTDNKGHVEISHLSAVFGAPEVISELIEYWGEAAPKGFADAWLDYCYFYGATPAEQTERYGRAFSGASLRQGRARLTPYYFRSKGGNDTSVAERVWGEFF